MAEPTAADMRWAVNTLSRFGLPQVEPYMVQELAEALAAAREQAEADSVMADGCLAMICDLLTALGTDMKSTPPMFYPEAIKSTIYRIVTEERTKASEQATSDAYSLISQAVHARGVLDCTDFERGPVVRRVSLKHTPNGKPYYGTFTHPGETVMVLAAAESARATP